MPALYFTAGLLLGAALVFAAWFRSERRDYMRSQSR